jgi:hypothetical protein
MQDAPPLTKHLETCMQQRMASTGMLFACKPDSCYLVGERARALLNPREQQASMPACLVDTYCGKKHYLKRP